MFQGWVDGFNGKRHFDVLRDKLGMDVTRKNGMTESVGTQKLFYVIVVHSKPFIEKIGICC